MNHFPKINIDLNGIYTKTINLSGSFLETAEKFADAPGTVILLSGGDLDCSKYHILAAKPWLSIKGFGRRLTLQTKHENMHFTADPFSRACSICSPNTSKLLICNCRLPPACLATLPTI